MKRMAFMLIMVTSFAAVDAVAQTGWVRNDVQMTKGGTYLISANGAFKTEVVNTIWSGSHNSSIGHFAVFKSGGGKYNFGEIWSKIELSGVMTSQTLIAVVQTDGNFCVYRAPISGSTRVWCSMVAPGNGEYFIALQDDGNLCEYKGTGPSNNRGVVWCSMTNQPVTWSVHGKEFTFPSKGSYGTAATGSLSSDAGGPVGVSISGGSPWVMNNTMLHLASNTSYCMTANADNSISTAPCSGAATQTGWSYQGTLHKGTSCVYLKWVGGSDATGGTQKPLLGGCETAQQFTY